jgi:hypothetical protein
MAAATIAIGAGLLMMPAHSQLSDGLIKAARMAVQNAAAKVEITTLQVGTIVPDRVIVEHYSHPYACGYVTSSYDRTTQRFIL